jgi:uncharacterized protein
MKQARAPHKQRDEHGKRIPVRSCVVCRSRFAQHELLRLVKDASSGAVRIDPKRHISGRGFYVCANPNCRTEKSLLRVSRNEAACLAAELETHFNPHSIQHRVSYELISPFSAAA